MDCNDFLFSFLKAFPSNTKPTPQWGRKRKFLHQGFHHSLGANVQLGSLGQDPRSDLGTDTLLSFSDSSLTQHSATDPKDSTGSLCKTQHFLSDFFLLLNSHTPNSLCPRQHSPGVAQSTDVRRSRGKVLKDQKTPQKLVQRNTTPVCCMDNAEKSSLILLNIKHRHFNYSHQTPPS